MPPSSNFSEWYPPEIEPVRSGWYQQLCGHGKDLGYQYWDNERKLWSAWFHNRVSWPVTAFIPSRDPWRGLTTPNG